MSFKKLLLLSFVTILNFTALDAAAVCIYNASDYPIKFIQTHGHKKAMTAKLPPNTHSCRKWNHPTLNAKGTKNATLGFKVTYFKKQPKQSKAQQAREIRRIFKIVKKGAPVQPIMDLPPGEHVCHEGISPTKSLTVVGQPGHWQCLINHRSEEMHADAVANFHQEPALPTHTGDCNKEYHECAAEARRCKGNNCVTNNQCQIEHNACMDYLASQVPQAPPQYAMVEPEVIYWGAAARHYDTPYFSWDYDSAKTAESSALAYCKKQHPKSAKECRVEMSFQNCAAAAFPHHGEQIYLVEDANLSSAEKEADIYCREETGDSCHVNWSFCANGDGGANNKIFYYGSIAKPKRGKASPVLKTNYHKANFARMNALRECQTKSNDNCREVVNFVTCAAYAESQDNTYYGWSRHEELSQSKRIALKNCQKQSGQNCHIVVAGCNRGFQ